MPETFTEPMVLFYRQGQSIAVLVVLPAISVSTASAAVLTADTIAQGTGSGTVGKGLLAKLGGGLLIGPLIGVFFAHLGTTVAASKARSERERAVILKCSRWGIILFCFVMSLGLAAVLSKAGKLYPASASAIVLGVCTWTAVLVGGILRVSARMDRAIKRIRIETHTTDEESGCALAARGKQLRQPQYIESKTRLGLAAQTARARRVSNVFARQSSHSSSSSSSSRRGTHVAARFVSQQSTGNSSVFATHRVPFMNREYRLPGECLA